MPRLDTDVVKVCKQFYACWSGFRVAPRMTANPLILYNLGTLAPVSEGLQPTSAEHVAVYPINFLETVEGRCMTL